MQLHAQTQTPTLLCCTKQHNDSNCPVATAAAAAHQISMHHTCGMQRLQAPGSVPQQQQPPQHLLVPLVLWQPLCGRKVGKGALVTKLLQ
jgi:hypothetical protein